jgi:hypothetical protein
VGHEPAGLQGSELLEHAVARRSQVRRQSVGRGRPALAESEEDASAEGSTLGGGDRPGGTIGHGRLARCIVARLHERLARDAGSRAALGPLHRPEG